MNMENVFVKLASPHLSESSQQLGKSGNTLLHLGKLDPWKPVLLIPYAILVARYICVPTLSAGAYPCGVKALKVALDPADVVRTAALVKLFENVKNPFEGKGTINPCEMMPKQLLPCGGLEALSMLKDLI